MNFDEIFHHEITLLILEYLPIRDLMKATRLPFIYRLVKDRLWWMNHRTPHQRALALEFAFEYGVEWIKEMLLFSLKKVQDLDCLFEVEPKIRDANDALARTIMDGYWWLIEPLIVRYKANPNHREMVGMPWDPEYNALVVVAAERAVEYNEPRILTEMERCGADLKLESDGSIGPLSVYGALCCNLNFDDDVSEWCNWYVYRGSVGKWTTDGKCRCFEDDKSQHKDTLIFLRKWWHMQH